MAGMSYQDYLAQGMSPNQAALQAQLGSAPSPVAKMGNQPVSPEVAAKAGLTGPSSPSPSPSGQTYGLEGFDTAKLNSDHNSPKYQIGRVLQNYDPSQGISDALLDDLNKLGIGTFSTNGTDKVMLSGNIDPRFEGYTTIDLIRNATGAGPKAWQYGAENPNAPAGGGRMLPTGGSGGADQYSAISALLSGDPLARIQQAIQSVNREGNVNLNALLQQLGA